MDDKITLNWAKSKPPKKLSAEEIWIIMNRASLFPAFEFRCDDPKHYERLIRYSFSNTVTRIYKDRYLLIGKSNKDIDRLIVDDFEELYG